MYYFVPLVVFHRPVALLSHPCRLPVAILSPSRRKKTPCRSPVALLSLSCRFLLSLPCRFPVAASPLALLSSSCCFPVAYPVAMSCFLSLPCRLPVATRSPPCRPPIALLSHLPCRLHVACLSLPVASLPLSCRWPVVFLSPPCRLRVAGLSPSCRSLPHFTVACLAWPESIVKYITVELKLNAKNEAHVQDRHGHGQRGHREDRHHREIQEDTANSAEDGSGSGQDHWTWSWEDHEETHFFAFVAHNVRDHGQDRSKWNR